LQSDRTPTALSAIQVLVSEIPELHLGKERLYVPMKLHLAWVTYCLHRQLQTSMLCGAGFETVDEDPGTLSDLDFLY
jgi:hypothetical protein